MQRSAPIDIPTTTQILLQALRDKESPEMVDPMQTPFMNELTSSSSTVSESEQSPSVDELNAERLRLEKQLDELINQHFRNRRIKSCWDLHMDKVTNKEILPSEGGFFLYPDYINELDKIPEIANVRKRYCAILENEEFQKDQFDKRYNAPRMGK